MFVYIVTLFELPRLNSSSGGELGGSDGGMGGGALGGGIAGGAGVGGGALGASSLGNESKYQYVIVTDAPASRSPS